MMLSLLDKDNNQVFSSKVELFLGLGLKISLGCTKIIGILGLL